MSKRVCFVGNSHLAAVKLAWAAHANLFPGIKVDFYGATRQQLRGLKLKRGLFRSYLYPQDKDLAGKIAKVSDGSVKLVPDRYQTVYLFSLGFNFQAAALLYRDFTAPCFKDNPAGHLLSDACFKAGIKAELMKSPAVHLVHQLQECSNTPIVVSAQPYPSEAIATVARRKHWQILKSSEDMQTLLSIYNEVSTKIANELGITILMPPETVEAQPGLTEHSYCEGALRLDLKTQKDARSVNYSHMNALYGKAVLDQILGA